MMAAKDAPPGPNGPGPQRASLVCFKGLGPGSFKAPLGSKSPGSPKDLCTCKGLGPTP